MIVVSSGGEIDRKNPRHQSCFLKMNKRTNFAHMHMRMRMRTRTQIHTHTIPVRNKGISHLIYLLRPTECKIHILASQTGNCISSDALGLRYQPEPTLLMVRDYEKCSPKMSGEPQSQPVNFLEDTSHQLEAQLSTGLLKLILGVKSIPNYKPLILTRIMLRAVQEHLYLVEKKARILSYMYKGNCSNGFHVLQPAKYVLGQTLGCV